MLRLHPVIAASAAVLALSGAIGLAAQARSPQGGSVPTAPDGLSFSEFRGYETWQVVAPSQVKDGLKIIAANDVMIRAYRDGLPAKGRTFPEGSRVVKIEWAPKPNPASPYPVTVPGELKSVSFIVKDSKRFPKTHGWAYAQFVFDPASRTLKPNGSGHECGYACHTAEAAQDYIFTAYPPR
jgi:hypothetical protein